MSKGKKSSIEGLFYNNKFLMIFSVVVAVLLWANVKINYSDDITRTVSDIKINIADTVTHSSDYIPFFGGEEFLAKVEVTGKAYNISQHTFSKDDVIVEATGTNVDSRGYKVLTLTAKLVDASATGDVTITKISPSTITVYFDRMATSTVSVEAVIENDLKDLVSDEFTLGQFVPSMNTVEVEGPATIINRVKKVNFTASIDKKELPLTATKDVPAEVSYQFDEGAKATDSNYITCESLNDESNPPMITIPLFINKQVSTSVKFANQPAAYSENPPEFTVYPDKINILYNSKDETIDSFNVGTVDFRNLSNTVNIIEFPVDENLGVNMVDKTIENFRVTVDMSHLSSVKLEKTPGKIVFSNQDENYNYNIDYDKSELSEITVIGPADELEDITPEDLQIDINVSTLNFARSGMQQTESVNISVASKEHGNCWVYGNYKVFISVEAKE